MILENFRIFKLILNLIIFGIKKYIYIEYMKKIYIYKIKYNEIDFLIYIFIFKYESKYNYLFNLYLGNVD